MSEFAFELTVAKRQSTNRNAQKMGARAHVLVNNNNNYRLIEYN